MKIIKDRWLLTTGLLLGFTIGNIDRLPEFFIGLLALTALMAFQQITKD